MIDCVWCDNDIDEMTLISSNCYLIANIIIRLIFCCMLLKSDLKNYYIRDSRYQVGQEHSLIVLLLHLSIYPMFKSGFGETPG